MLRCIKARPHLYHSDKGNEVNEDDELLWEDIIEEDKTQIGTQVSAKN